MGKNKIIHKLDDLAKISYMNKSYFLHQFKKLFNISPMRYLTLVRIEQSKLLLSSTDHSITQISSMVGINNPVYFTEIFTNILQHILTKFYEHIFTYFLIYKAYIIV